MDLSLPFDYRVDDEVAISPSQVPSSSQWIAVARAAAHPAEGDFVKWQSSQVSCHALDSLMAEVRHSAAHSPLRRKHTSSFDWSPGTSSSGHSPLYDSVAEISTSSTSASKASTSRRAKSRVHPSRAKQQDSIGDSQAASIPGLSISSTPARFIDMLQDIPKKANKASHSVASRRRPEKENRHSLVKLSSVGESSTSVAGPRDKDGGPPPIVGHRSLPNMNTVSDVDNHDTAMEVDSPSSSAPPNMASPSVPNFAVEYDPKMPPPPQPHAVPVPKHIPPTTDTLPRPPRTRAASRHASPAISKSQYPKPYVRPQPQPNRPASFDKPPLEKPISNPPAKTTNPQKVTKPQPVAPPSTLRPPRPSQPTNRPPVLGMRPIIPYSVSVFSSSQTLPSKQKGFKPPLARPIAPNPPLGPLPVPATSSHDCYQSAKVVSAQQPASLKTSTTPSRVKKVNHTSSSPPPPAEADSSFGDMSFDMDELEETMKMYD